MMRLALSALLILAFATVGSATTISDISGSVLVDQGNGFKAVKATSDIPVGSRVLVTRGGNAVIAFNEGCQKTLAPNSITTVASSGNCAPSAQVAAQGFFPSFFSFFNPSSWFSFLGTIAPMNMISFVVFVPVVAGAFTAVFVGVQQANNPPAPPVPPISR